MKKLIHGLIALVLCGAAACTAAGGGRQDGKQAAAAAAAVPLFSADSAYRYVQQQVDFGPRVPGTEAHRACARFLAAKLQALGATVTEQRVDLRAFDGTVLPAVNIIGAFRPECRKRIALFAHWDCRPWADHDPDPTRHTEPVPGANDGASGVGVLLEVARHLGQRLPEETGVDIILFDAEDYGAPEHLSSPATADSWALGSQHWAAHPHVAGYHARYGILLDMVGAPNATFYREQISDYYAPHIVDRVWSRARALGFDGYFVDRPGGAITDDHLYVNRTAGIPTIDIIQRDTGSATGFGRYWHTTDDTMAHIDRNTLQAVGTTVLHVIYE